MQNACRWLGKLTKRNHLKILSNLFILCMNREITFENAEELTEEGLPFLILFHATDDHESIKDFKTVVETQLISEKG